MGERLNWVIDFAAATILAAAVTVCGTLMGAPSVGAIAGAAALLAGLGLLRAIAPEPRTFSLPAFEPADLQAVPAEPVPTLTNVHRLRPGARQNAGGRERSRLPGPGGAADIVVQFSPDAGPALRQALAELNRSRA